uniref:Gypsy retrotransposon integrase 1 n=1 Tax=Nothobranchius furzeri TaxID=105023 RepID=A0A1A8AN70_NOTFU
MQHNLLQTQVKELRGDFDIRSEHQDDSDVSDDLNGDRGRIDEQMPLSRHTIEPPTPRAIQLHKKPKILPLSPEDDTEHYLMTFERIATVCQWSKEWAIQLIPLLTGKARSAYVLTDIDSCVYEKVKDVILAKYEITKDTERDFELWKSTVIMPRELYA